VCSQSAPSPLGLASYLFAVKFECYFSSKFFEFNTEFYEFDTAGRELRIIRYKTCLKQRGSKPEGVLNREGPAVTTYTLAHQCSQMESQRCCQDVRTYVEQLQISI
jgi:hypothetical protein